MNPLEKAKKGAPQNEEWLRKFREKRGAKSSSKVEKAKKGTSQYQEWLRKYREKRGKQAPEDQSTKREVKESIKEKLSDKDRKHSLFFSNASKSNYNSLKSAVASGKDFDELDFIEKVTYNSMIKDLEDSGFKATRPKDESSESGIEISKNGKKIRFRYDITEAAPVTEANDSELQHKSLLEAMKHVNEYLNDSTDNTSEFSEGLGSPEKMKNFNYAISSFNKNPNNSKNLDSLNKQINSLYEDQLDYWDLKNEDGKIRDPRNKDNFIEFDFKDGVRINLNSGKDYQEEFPKTANEFMKVMDKFIGKLNESRKGIF